MSSPIRGGTPGLQSNATNGSEQGASAAASYRQQQQLQQQQQQQQQQQSNGQLSCGRRTGLRCTVLDTRRAVCRQRADSSRHDRACSVPSAINSQYASEAICTPATLVRACIMESQRSPVQQA